LATLFTTLTITQDEATADVQRDLYAENGLKELAGLKLLDYMRKCVSGARAAKIHTKINPVKASGTITLSAHVATDTVTVNGITFTAVASGATGNQYNIGGSDTITGDNLAAALNANVTLAAMILASNALGVVTISSLHPGAIGNAVTIAISAHGTASGARLTGGTNGDTETTHYFGQAT
jgi:hypothetical protein